MFGNNKQTDSKTSTTTPSPGGSGLNALVKGTSMEGNIKCDSDLRIDGTIKGNVQCKAKLIIGPTGAIEGEVQCQNAVIEGRFKGVLRVSDLLNVRETADVDGDINTNKLIVQSGAKFNVACKMDTGSNNGASKSVDKSNDTANIAAGKTTVNN
jgi:cytoskeletal protein CcmA (bactofilin family)